MTCLENTDSLRERVPFIVVHPKCTDRSVRQVIRASICHEARRCGLIVVALAWSIISPRTGHDWSDLQTRLIIPSKFVDLTNGLSPESGSQTRQMPWSDSYVNGIGKVPCVACKSKNARKRTHRGLGTETNIGKARRFCSCDFSSVHSFLLDFDSRRFLRRLALISRLGPGALQHLSLELTESIAERISLSANLLTTIRQQLL